MALSIAVPGARSIGHERRLLVGLALALAPVAFLVSTVPGVRPHVGYNLLLDGLLNNIAYAIAPIVSGLRARRAATYRGSWWALTTGLALYGLGNVYWTVLIRPQDPEPFPSGADLLWLAFYPCMFIALLLMLRERTERLPLSMWLDGLVGGLAVTAIAAAAVVGPLVDGTSGSFAAVATTTAYPLLDLLLLLLVVATLSLFHWRPPIGLWLLAGGLALFVVADVAYLFATARGTYESGGVGDGVWVLATLVMAGAPGWRDKPAGLRLPAWAVLAVPVAAAGSALTLMVYDHDHRIHPVAVGLATGTVVLALVRLIVTFREASSLADSHRLALTDELTGLGNRRALYERAPASLLSLDASRSAALLLLDLDRFKEVNDSLGHHAGDLLLGYVGQRLSACVRGAEDVLVRLGGDEFALLLVGTDAATAEQIAARMRDVIADPFIVDGVTVRAEASVGIAMCTAGSADLPTLLREADVAMYQAKARRVGVSRYSADDDMLGGHERLDLLEELRSAIENRSLVVHYQPKVDAQTLNVTGVEALVRWQHSVRGLLYPADFLPLVEDAGLMRDLTTAVLEQSLDQVARWRAGDRLLTVAVNLSASSLVDLDLPDRVLRMLTERGLAAECLELEITEDFLMADRQRAREILASLRSQGIRVVVDDFGTGYSSLAYLKELPIDELKLDKSFVKSMAEDGRSAAIVRSTIGLAHSLGLRLVAEGVENSETADELARSGCDIAQGFFFARPLPADELEDWLDDHGHEIEPPAGLVTVDALSAQRSVGAA
ncbi:MAG: putative bifunctional diguanylate cyclase/phosphodiesterase [Frankiaceae bacterium]